jgi:hypothetical protein
MTSFRIEERTRVILTNFGKINPVVATESGGPVFASATVQPFERDYVIEGVPALVKALSRFDQPRLKFEAGVLQMFEGNVLINSSGVPISFPQPDHLQFYKAREPELAPCNVTFGLSRDTLAAMTAEVKGRNVLFLSRGGKIVARIPEHGTGAPEFLVDRTNKDFGLVLKAWFLDLFLSDDYRVEINVPSGPARRPAKAVPKIVAARFVGSFIKYVIPTPPRYRSATALWMRLPPTS